MEKKLTAIVIGATGLVGSSLVKLLLNTPEFGKVKIFTRRAAGIENPELEEIIIDFDKPEEWQGQVSGDVLFSTLGTTIKAAKTKENQYKVDFTYQYNFAQAAAKNKVPHYVLVSSVGANPKSSIFYSRMKGELDVNVQQLPFDSVTIFRPSVLVGDRKNKRMGEEIAAKLTDIVTRIIFKKYKPIKGEIVAKAMINSVLRNLKNPKTKIFELDQLFELAG